MHIFATTFESCESTDTVRCVGSFLVWNEGNDPFEDANKSWRKTFSFQPSQLIDTWTPFFFGLLAIGQTIPSFQSKTFSGSWGRCLAFYLLAVFVAIFGYAGNWGVFWGFFAIMGICPVLVYLSIFDNFEAEHESTQVNLTTYLAMCKIVSEQHPNDQTNNEEQDEKNVKRFPDRPKGPSMVQYDGTDPI